MTGHVKDEMCRDFQDNLTNMLLGVCFQGFFFFGLERFENFSNLTVKFHILLFKIHKLESSTIRRQGAPSCDGKLKQRLMKAIFSCRASEGKSAIRLQRVNAVKRISTLEWDIQTYVA